PPARPEDHVAGADGAVARGAQYREPRFDVPAILLAPGHQPGYAVHHQLAGELLLLRHSPGTHRPQQELATDPRLGGHVRPTTITIARRQRMMIRREFISATLAAPA